VKPNGAGVCSAAFRPFLPARGRAEARTTNPSHHLKGVRLALAGLLSFLSASAAAWDGSPGPHDGHHLVVVRPTDFGDVVADEGAIFGKKAVRIAGPRAARLHVKHAGRYTLWARAASLKGFPIPLAAELCRDGKAVLKGALLDGKGDAERGGPAGFEAYAEKAAKSAPGDAGGADELLSEAERAKRPKSWALLTRIEHPSGDRRYYWWKLGAAELTPGDYELRLAPQGAVEADKAPHADAAFLSTCLDLAYPYAGDIDAPSASYIRFRVEAGVTISAGLRIHSDPWSTPRVWLNPSGLSAKEREAHAKPGVTRWYRLQDIERTPAFGPTECRLLLQIGGEPRMGATQFAVFPHQDYVLREIAWDEPEGLNVSMATDFGTYLHKLRTFRDHERENYERALAATGGRLFPLTRGDLHFGNAWGRASGDCFDYMVKTLRLLGFNCVDASADPTGSRKLYGWTSHTGQYWPPAFLPFDEAEARRKYDAHYKGFADKQRELYEGVSIYQIADEPGEIARTEMSAPIWLFDDAKGKWADPVGGSDLNTRSAALRDCVLEGKVEKHGDAIGFRVGMDNAEKPTAYAYWEIGRVGPSYTVNLAAGKVGLKPEGRITLGRPEASIGGTPTPFKIVYEGGSAALFVNERLVHQHSGLPEKGGFGFSGGQKAIAELRLRPIRKDEHIAVKPPAAAAKELKLKDDGAEELELEPTKQPEWAKPRPLKEFVEKEWVPSGGMPEAHAAFRKWAAERGATPGLFGKKAWDDVRLLTLPSLVKDAQQSRLFAWSRRFSSWLTPRMFALSAEAIRKHAPNPRMRGFVALSGHALYFPSEMPLDMFQLAGAGEWLMPGISDWMSLGSWRWDSHQAVAFSVAPYNAGARRYGQEPASFPMMHCVWPSAFRAYTMLANQVRYISFYNYGPMYAITEGGWNEDDWAYRNVHATANRAAQCDDILASARARPSRVAMLYAHSTEYWNAQSSFADKRAAFLALSHEYYQPELVTEDQVASGALKHYDALFVLEPWVAAAAQEAIAAWVRRGGLLCAYADALTRDEYNDPADVVARLARIERKLEEKTRPQIPQIPQIPDPNPVSISVQSVDGLDFRPHSVVPTGMPVAIEANGARLRARYSDGRPAWLERPVGKGKVVYIGHRPGLTYTAKAIRRNGYETVWADTGRALLTAPLHEAKVPRELVLSEPLVVAAPMSTEAGTVLILYNMRPTPLANVKIGLAEPAPPRGVAAFDCDRLVRLPFEYRDGRVWVTLRELDGGQMIVVRRKPAPPDDRWTKMRERTEQQLASTDWQALSAGAWFAGFFPDWGLGPKVVPLLKHDRWQVRRAAAEAIGQLHHLAALNELAATIETERDTHALADELAALCYLEPVRGGKVCAKFLGHPSVLVRCRAVAGAWDAAAALADPDLRVRIEGIRLLVDLESEKGVALAAARATDAQERPHWADAFTASNATFAAYLKGGMQGNDALLLAIAGRRAAPELAKALLARAAELAAAEPAAFAHAAIVQRDKPLARALFAQRSTLPRDLAAALPLILEHTFDARLGDVMEDWEQQLRKQ